MRTRLAAAVLAVAALTMPSTPAAAALAISSASAAAALAIPSARAAAAIAIPSAPAAAALAVPSAPAVAVPGDDAPSRSVTPSGPQGPTGGNALTWSVAPSGPQGPNGRTALDYKLDPGATVTDHIAVTNHSRRPLTLRLYASDAFTTAGGGFDLLAAGAAPRDAGRWVTLARATVTLAKSSRAIIPITLTVPANATPGDHAAGVVASLTDAGTDGRVTVDHRVGTRLYLRITGALRPALALDDVQLKIGSSWNPLRFPHLTATFKINNIGNVRVSTRPSAHAHGPFGVGGSQATGPALPEILPGGSVRTSIRLDSIPPLLRSQVVLAAGETESRHTLWLVPWSQLALLAAVATVVITWVLTRRRRRRVLRKAIAAAEHRGRQQATTTAKSAIASPSSATGSGPATTTSSAAAGPCADSAQKGTP